MGTGFRIGVVGTRGGWSTERLADAVEEATGHRWIVEMRRTRLDLESGQVTCEGVDLGQLDALIIKKLGASYSPDLLDRLEILRWLHARGLKIFSSPESIRLVLDRLSCTIGLRLAGVPMPPTTITEDPEEALAALDRYGEAVFKPLFTSKARGMCLIAAGDGAREEIESYRRVNPVMYIQQRVSIPGRDLGIVFLGGEYLTTYARGKELGAWSTTTAFGGRYEPYAPDPAIIELARRAQAPFGLDFTCVDVVETGGEPLVFEVSAFGGFRGLLAAGGIDAARAYTTYVLGRLR